MLMKKHIFYLIDRTLIILTGNGSCITFKYRIKENNLLNIFVYYISLVDYSIN